MKKICLLSFIFLFFGMNIFAEGTLQLITCPTCEAGMSLNDKAQFAYPGLAEDRRLHIRIADPANEQIYVALSQEWYVQLVSPDGADVYIFDGTAFTLNGTPATFPNTIADYTQSSQGPNGITQAGAGAPTSGSYDAISFAPNVAGDWYIEFTDKPDFSTPTESVRSKYWDISVVDASTAANNVINGRIWSYQWGMRSGPGSTFPGPGPRLNTTFFIYTEPEQVVTSIEIGDPDNPGWGGDWLIACNRYGVIQNEYDAGNPAEARKSIDGDADEIHGALSEYKIFINEPDINEFPSGIDEITISTIDLDECGSGEIFITFNTNVEGVGDISLDFPPYGSGTEDITYLAQSILLGANTIEWDRLDGNGNMIPDGTVFKVGLFVSGSVVHLPLYDIEGLTGLKARLVRPGTPDYIGLYWDNTNLGGDALTMNPGCISSDSEICNDYGYANQQTLNVWWNGLNTDVEADVVVPTNIQVSVNVPDTAVATCGSEGIIVTVEGQAANVNSIRWTTSGTGYFDAPNALTPIYHASAQDSIAGVVTLTLSGSACPDVTDFTVVDFEDELCALPISLSSFEATVLNANEHCEGIKVTWTTQTEENTDYFLLERSSDGIHYMEVDRVLAAGFSLSVQEYLMIDKNVGSKNHYRLTVFDLDGSSESMSLDNLVYTDCFRDINVNDISEVFPNPVMDNTVTSYLKINIIEATQVNINVIDIHGRLVTSIPKSLMQGENLVDFNLQGLQAGTYFVSLMSNEWQTGHKKIVKLN